MEEASGEVIIQRPSSERDLVLKDNTVGDVSLGNGIFALHAAGFPLSGQKSEEVQIPVFRLEFGM